MTTPLWLLILIAVVAISYQFGLRRGIKSVGQRKSPEDGNELASQKELTPLLEFVADGSPCWSLSAQDFLLSNAEANFNSVAHTLFFDRTLRSKNTLLFSEKQEKVLTSTIVPIVRSALKEQKRFFESDSTAGSGELTVVFDPESDIFEQIQNEDPQLLAGDAVHHLSLRNPPSGSWNLIDDFPELDRKELAEQILHLIPDYNDWRFNELCLILHFYLEQSAGKECFCDRVASASQSDWEAFKVFCKQAVCTEQYTPSALDEAEVMQMEDFRTVLSRLQSLLEVFDSPFLRDQNKALSLSDCLTGGIIFVSCAREPSVSDRFAVKLLLTYCSNYTRFTGDERQINFIIPSLCQTIGTVPRSFEYLFSTPSLSVMAYTDCLRGMRKLFGGEDSLRADGMVPEFLSLFKNWIFIPPVSLEAAAKASKRAGNMLIRSSHRQQKSHKAIVYSSPPNPELRGEKVQARQLLTADEVGRPETGVSTFFLDGFSPFQAKIVDESKG